MKRQVSGDKRRCGVTNPVRLGAHNVAQDIDAVFICKACVGEGEWSEGGGDDDDDDDDDDDEDDDDDDNNDNDNDNNDNDDNAMTSELRTWETKHKFGCNARGQRTGHSCNCTQGDALCGAPSCREG